MVCAARSMPWCGQRGSAGARKQQPQVVVDFGDRADGGARIVRAGLLLDGDRRRQPLDAVDVRLVHHRQELARVGRQRLDVAALALRHTAYRRRARTCPSLTVRSARSAARAADPGRCSCRLWVRAPRMRMKFIRLGYRKRRVSGGWRPGPGRIGLGGRSGCRRRDRRAQAHCAGAGKLRPPGRPRAATASSARLGTYPGVPPGRPPSTIAPIRILYRQARGTTDMRAGSTKSFLSDIWEPIRRRGPCLRA